MQSCGVLDLDIWPGGGDVVSDLTFFLAMVFAWIYLHGFTRMDIMDLFTWIYSHGFIRMSQLSVYVAS